MKNALIFKAPPSSWEEYLPLGNGRLGVMQKAHPCTEVLQLNEENVWSGGPQDRINPDTFKNLEKIRSLVKQGRVALAQETAFRAMSGTSFNERVYQTAGEFRVDFFSKQREGLKGSLPVHEADNASLLSYNSVLDLKDAVSVLSYTDDNGVSFTRRTWVSAADDMIFMHVKASKPSSICFRGYLDRGIWADSVYAKDSFIFLSDSHGIPFTVGAGVVCKNGAFGTTGSCLVGNDCDEALFFLDIQTFRWNKEPLSKSEYDKLIQNDIWTPNLFKKLCDVKAEVEKDFDKTVQNYLKKHQSEYQSFYNRMEFNLELASETQTPTPELLEAVKNKDASPQSYCELLLQYCNFSRYLLISSSRKPGILPATLQGLWNCYMDPPWGSKYTVNINLQMNYWPSLMCNLFETHESVFELLERAYENGKKAAREMYHCNGYVVHHNLDYWGDAAPQDCWLPGTYWVLGAAWIATHIWEHYEYTRDEALLERYYYLIHEACRFFVDFLTPSDLIASDGKPYLVINPTVSPENSYITKAGESGSFSAGCEMDNMILEHLFSSCLKALAVLKDRAHNREGERYSKDEAERFAFVLSHIKAPGLNSDGSLMEWSEEVSEVEPGHRHISHLYGLFPGHTISVERTPELASAAKKTLEKRLSNGGGHTGWSQAWIINFRAALRQGKEADFAIRTLLSRSTLNNLLDNHPPFQIDGNFGALAGIMRLLVQSETDGDKVIVRLLPSLPPQSEWQSGEVRGIKVRGNHTVDFSWKDGKVVSYTVTPLDSDVEIVLPSV